jgi:hypothetical protein
MASVCQDLSVPEWHVAEEGLSCPQVGRYRGLRAQQVLCSAEGLEGWWGRELWGKSWQIQAQGCLGLEALRGRSVWVLDMVFWEDWRIPEGPECQHQELGPGGQ